MTDLTTPGGRRPGRDVSSLEVLDDVAAGEVTADGVLVDAPPPQHVAAAHTTSATARAPTFPIAPSIAVDSFMGAESFGRAPLRHAPRHHDVPRRRLSVTAALLS